MGPAARIEPGPKSFWGLNWLQNQDFGQSITKARVNKETGIVDCIVKQTIFKNATVGMNHFADEIAHLMFNYNTASNL
jgi:hypothetical protein